MRLSLGWVLFATAHCSGGSTRSVGAGNGSSGSEVTQIASDDAGGGSAIESGDEGGTSVSGDAQVSTVEPDAGAVAGSTADFPIAPLHLAANANAHGEDARVDVELRADGTLYSHGLLLGQISGRRVIAPNGRDLLTVTPEGVFLLNGTATRVRMREAGDILMPNGTVLTFSPEGVPLAIAPDQHSQPGPARVEGFRPELRRTAALLAVIAATVTMPTR